MVKYRLWNEGEMKMAATPRERLIERLETMTDDEIEEVLEFAEQLKYDELPADYDPAKDPFITGEAFFEGPTDLGAHAEDYLEGFGLPETKDEEAK
jgi:hypothetical protein